MAEAEGCSTRNRDASKKSRKRRRERENNLAGQVSKLEETRESLRAIEQENWRLQAEHRRLKAIVQAKSASMEDLRRRRQNSVMQQFELLTTRLSGNSEALVTGAWEEDIVLSDCFNGGSGSGSHGDGGDPSTRRGRAASLRYWQQSTIGLLDDAEFLVERSSFPEENTLLLEFTMSGVYAGVLPAICGQTVSVSCAAAFAFRPNSEKVASIILTRDEIALLHNLGVVIGGYGSGLLSVKNAASVVVEAAEEWPMSKRQRYEKGCPSNIKIAVNHHEPVSMIKQLQAEQMRRVLSLYPRRGSLLSKKTAKKRIQGVANVTAVASLASAA